jgi:predicted hydrocarbon binding protein
LDDTEKKATNIAIRASLDGVIDILGKNGAKIIFRNAGILHVFENPPEYNWEPCVTIPEQAKIYTEISNLVGYNGALGVWRRVGYSVMKCAAEIGHAFDAFYDLGAKEQFAKGMELFIMGSGKGKAVYNEDGSIDFDCFDCLHCKGCDFNRPMCTHYEGFIQYIADSAFGKNKYIAKETKCMAMGDDTCYFQLIEKE